MLNRKTLLIICLLTAIFFTLYASITEEAYASQTDITVWHAVPSENAPLFERIVDEYVSKTKGTVSVHFKRFESAEALYRRLMSGSDHPDVALIDTRWQGEINKRHKLVYMEDLMLKTVGKSVYIVFKMDTFEPMWNSCKYEGRLLSMPFAGYNRALIINEDILSQYSIKKLPEMWGDLIFVGKQFSIAGGAAPAGAGAFMIPVNDSPESLATFFQVFLWQAGKDVVQPFKEGELVGFDGDEGKTILKMMVDMSQAQKSGYPVNKENAAMFIGTPQDYINLTNKGKKLRVIRWPGNKKNITANDLSVLSFVVFAGSDDNKLAKIWHLVYEACEFKAGSKWALETPFLPPNKQITLSPGYFEMMKTYPGMRIFVQQLKNSRVSIRDEKRDIIMHILGQNLKMAMKGNMTIEEALNQSADKANELLDPEGTLREQKAASSKTSPKFTIEVPGAAKPAAKTSTAKAASKPAASAKATAPAKTATSAASKPATTQKPANVTKPQASSAGSVKKTVEKKPVDKYVEKTWDADYRKSNT